MRRKQSNQWILQIFFLTFFLAVVISVIAEVTIKNFNILGSIIILFAIIALGVIFDVVGIAVTAADVKPFNAMAARKVKGAKKAVGLVVQADRVSNFCNDVVGDIAGIISGAAIASIAVKMARFDMGIFNISLVAVLLSGMTAALTVGGKAYGKSIAIRKWKEIVFYSAYVLYIMESKIKIRILKQR